MSWKLDEQSFEDFKQFLEDFKQFLEDFKQFLEDRKKAQGNEDLKQYLGNAGLKQYLENFKQFLEDRKKALENFKQFLEDLKKAQGSENRKKAQGNEDIRRQEDSLNKAEVGLNRAGVEEQEKALVEEQEKALVGVNKVRGSQKKITKLEQRILKLEEKLREQRNIQAQHQQTIKELQQRNMELEQKNAEHKEKVKDQANKLSSSTDKLKGSQKKITELEQKNLKLEEKLQEQRNIQEYTPGLLCYKLNSRPRGLCVLINNLNFQNKTENRNGSQIDEKGVKDLFSELSFAVSVLNDLSHDKMRKAAVDFASKDHSQFDAFVFVVMSHGGERDIIYGVDRRTTRVEDLMSEFKAPNCPTLRNKPKLFFIQTCRGTTEDKTFSATTGSSDSCMDTFSPDSTLPRSVCPQEADFLLAFATAPGYVAWRNQQSGSFFVQTLVEVIRKRHFHDHLLDMLTEVNRLVVERGQTANGRPVRIQIPAPVHTLRAKLYL